MRIALINYVYEPGIDADTLLERYASLTGWAESLLAAGAEAVTVAQRFGRDADVERGGVRYLLRADGGGPIARPWTHPGRLHQAVAALRPDVAHVNGLHFPAQTWRLGRALPRGVALVVQDHGGAPARGIGRRALARLGLRAADAFLFTAADMACPWRAAGVIEPRQAVYAVPEASRALRRLPQGAARTQSGVCGDPALLWVGHLDANKDPLTVLEGFARALPLLPGARLMMVFAKTGLLPAVRAYLSDNPALAERVVLRGAVPYAELAAFFSAADIFVLGSRRESCGFALIEALMCGATPVVTDIPAFRALTAGASPAALWPPGDAARFAERLVDVTARDLAAQRPRIAAYAERELSWPAIGRRAIGVYVELSEAKREG
jgi:glycosyltransferase involved in cell wall biosynthesis